MTAADQEKLFAAVRQLTHAGAIARLAARHRDDASDVTEALWGVAQLVEHAQDAVDSVIDATRVEVGLSLGTHYPMLLRGALAIGERLGMGPKQVHSLHQQRKLPTFAVYGCPCATPTALDEWRKLESVGVLAQRPEPLPNEAV